jgi:hypothetical protein
LLQFGMKRPSLSGGRSVVFAVTEVLALFDMAASSRGAKVSKRGPRRTRIAHAIGH